MNLSLYIPDKDRPRLREIQDLARGAGLSISGEFMRFLEDREEDLRRLCSERLARVMGESPAGESVIEAENPVDAFEKTNPIVERYLNRHAR